MNTVVSKSLVPPRKRRGSLLVEVCIGIIVIAIALLGIMAAFTMTVKSVVTARDSEAATFIALGLINEMEGVPFADMYVYHAQSLDIPSGYSGSVVINPPNPDENTASVNIRVSVGRTGASSRVTMEREVSGNAASNSAVFN